MLHPVQPAIKTCPNLISIQFDVDLIGDIFTSMVIIYFINLFKTAGAVQIEFLLACTICYENKDLNLRYSTCLE